MLMCPPATVIPCAVGVAEHAARDVILVCCVSGLGLFFFSFCCEIGTSSPSLACRSARKRILPFICGHARANEGKEKKIACHRKLICQGTDRWRCGYRRTYDAEIGTRRLVGGDCERGESDRVHGRAGAGGRLSSWTPDHRE